MWLRRVLMTIAILAVVGAGGYVLYNVAYGIGDAAGYDDGYLAGHNVGYLAGSEDGYDEGYTLGQDDGYIQGQADGYAEGYAVGIEAGTGHGYCLKDPTYGEAIAFLNSDLTDWNEYTEDYVCSHFSRDVCNNAEAAGLRCAFVELRFADSGHTIIAFDTIDRGLVYFEPQFDDEVELEIGKSYSFLNGYVAPSVDDHIEDILVIW